MPQSPLQTPSSQQTPTPAGPYYFRLFQVNIVVENWHEGRMRTRTAVMPTHCRCPTRRLCKNDCHYLAAKKTSVEIPFHLINEPSFFIGSFIVW